MKTADSEMGFKAQKTSYRGFETGSTCSLQLFQKGDKCIDRKAGASDQPGQWANRLGY